MSDIQDTGAALRDLARRCELATGPDGELDMLIWAALNGVTGITYPDSPQEFSTSGRVEGIGADGRHKLLGWIDPGKEQRNWQPYGGDTAYPNVTASLDAAMKLVPKGWRVAALEEDWKTSLWRAQLGPKPSQALIDAYVAGRTVGWETADAPDNGRAAIATPMLALAAAALRARAASVDRSGEAGETRSEAKGLDPKDESAVGAEGAETPTPSPFSGDPQ